jgi:hypothetical protein
LAASNFKLGKTNLKIAAFQGVVLMRKGFRFGLVSSVLALVAALLFTSGSARAQADVKGQRVYSTSTQHHYPLLALRATQGHRLEIRLFKAYFTGTRM